MLFRFANPQYLYLLILIPLLLGWYIFTRIQRKKYLKEFGDLDIIKNLMPGVSQFKQNLKFCIQLLALVGIIFVMARPQFGSKLETVKKKGLEVMVALDISNSMLAEDIRPNRLEKSKQMLYKLLDDLNNDKFGVIIFAGKPFTQLPITTDYQAAKMFISSIQPGSIRQQGTAIGAALNLAARSFSENEENNKGQAVIVITDGENHEDDAVQTAKELAGKGIHVYVIGIGDPKGAPIPMAGTKSMKKDKDGNTVITKLNETMCREIAVAGEGAYIHADNTNDAIKALQKELDKISKDDVDSKVYSEYDEQFPPIAWIIIALLIIEIIILERKNGLFRDFKLFD